jgi:hypothetical protein
LEALRSYRYAYNEKLQTFSREPLHDWASHDADAFRYLACFAQVAEVMTRKTQEQSKPSGPRALDSYTLDELWDANSGPSRRERV